MANTNATSKKILFCDAEAASLRGEIFAASLVGAAGITVFDGYYMHSVMKDAESWQAQNIKFSGTEFPERAEFLKAFLETFESARVEYGTGEYSSLTVCGHMPAPVEANLFQQLFAEVGMGEFSGPYHLVNTDTLLLLAGEPADSESAYAEKFGIELPSGYVPHTALSDAQLTRLVWEHLTERISFS
jgi:hypothetical protein